MQECNSFKTNGRRRLTRERNKNQQEQQQRQTPTADVFPPRVRTGQDGFPFADHRVHFSTPRRPNRFCMERVRREQAKEIHR